MFKAILVIVAVANGQVNIVPLKTFDSGTEAGLCMSEKIKMTKKYPLLAFDCVFYQKSQEDAKE